MSRLSDLLARELAKSARVMAERHDVSHSFTVVNEGCEHTPPVSYTVLILFTPSTMDQAIYDVLKPIIEKVCGEGTMVEPNPKAAHVGKNG